MRRQVVVTKSISDDMKIEINITTHVKNFPSPDPATAQKNRREKDTKTKKRPAKDDSTTAKKPRHSKNKEKNNGKWKCAICTHKEEKNEKICESTAWQCGICEKYISSKANLERHVITTHSKKKNTAVACGDCGKEYSTKTNLIRHIRDKHPDAVAAATKKTVLMKGNEKISNHKGKVHSGAPVKVVAALREKKGEIKDTSHSTEPQRIVRKFTEYECRCGKTEDTYDASVRHAQEHLVELEALIRANGTQCELKFDRHNRDDNNNRPLIQTKFNYKKLLKNSWFNMFERKEWSSNSSTILASSLYKYTRCVKLNWEKEVGGQCVPLYKCIACDLFVDPAKVELHCENYQACLVCAPKGYKCTQCEKKFQTPKAMSLHEEDHKTHKDLRFKIVTFNNEDDEQFNKALRRMSPPSVAYTQAEIQGKVSGSPETPERNVLEKNYVHNNEAISVLKYCNLCKRSYSDLEDHNAYHENKSKRIMETIAREQSCSAEAAEAAPKKQNNGNTEKEEPEENVSKSLVMEWNSDSDSDDDDDDRQSFNTFNLQAQLNLTPKYFGRIVTKKDEIKQKTYNDCKKLLGNRKNDDDAVKGVIVQSDQFDQCELTLGKIFGENNIGVDTLESDNESQSTEDLQRVLEGDAESDLRGDE